MPVNQVFLKHTCIDFCAVVIVGFPFCISLDNSPEISLDNSPENSLDNSPENSPENSPAQY